MDDFARVLYGDLMQTHETAHQWWGGVVSWGGYRDQWLLEALANYSAMMLLERSHPDDLRTALDYYRNQLLRKTDTGRQYLQAGPVTLGVRLGSSQFPDGYVIISYGRGTWLFHMLRHMLRDAVVSGGGTPQAGDELFLHALHNLRDRYAFKQMTSQDVLKVFEEVLPENLKFERRKSLDWFYEGWVNGTAVPRYSVTDVKIVKGATTSASFTLRQDDAPSELVTSVPIYAVVNNSNRPVLVARVFADGTGDATPSTRPGRHAQVARRPVPDGTFPQVAIERRDIEFANNGHPLSAAEAPIIQNLKKHRQTGRYYGCV